MARPRDKDVAPTRFTTGEVARATRLPLRSVIYLCEKGLLPAEGGGSMSSHRLLGVEGLVRAAMTGAFYCSGIDVAKSAKLVEALIEGEEFGAKIALAGLDELLHLHRKMYPEAGRRIPRNVPLVERPFYLHQVLRSSEIYERDTGVLFDQIIRVLDGSYVFLTALVVTEEESYVDPGGAALLKIESFEKSSRDMKLERLNPNVSENIESELYTSVLTVNISLATRNALDAVADERAK